MFDGANEYCSPSGFTGPTGDISTIKLSSTEKLNVVNLNQYLDGLDMNTAACIAYMSDMIDETTGEFNEPVLKAYSLNLRKHGDKSPLKHTSIETKGNLQKLYVTRSVMNNTKKDLYAITYDGKTVKLTSRHEGLKFNEYDRTNFVDEHGFENALVIKLETLEGGTMLEYAEPPTKMKPTLIKSIGMLVFESMDDIAEFESVYGTGQDIINSYVFGKHITNRGFSVTLVNLSEKTKYYCVRSNNVYEVPRVDEDERQRMIKELDLQDDANLNTKDLFLLCIEAGYDEKLKKRNILRKEKIWVERISKPNPEALFVRDGFFVFNDKAYADEFCKQFGNNMWEYIKAKSYDELQDEFEDKLLEMKAKYERAMTQMDGESVEDKKTILKMASAVAGSAVIELVIIALVNHFLRKDKENETLKLAHDNWIIDYVKKRNPAKIVTQEMLDIHWNNLMKENLRKVAKLTSNNLKRKITEVVARNYFYTKQVEKTIKGLATNLRVTKRESVSDSIARLYNNETNLYGRSQIRRMIDNMFSRVDKYNKIKKAFEIKKSTITSIVTPVSTSNKVTSTVKAVSYSRGFFGRLWDGICGFFRRGKEFICGVGRKIKEAFIGIKELFQEGTELVKNLISISDSVESTKSVGLLKGVIGFVSVTGTAVIATALVGGGLMLVL